MHHNLENPFKFLYKMAIPYLFSINLPGKIHQNEKGKYSRGLSSGRQPIV